MRAAWSRSRSSAERSASTTRTACAIRIPTVYDMTEYIKFGEENLITVRADASLEEGWFYEGAGIYRNVYLHKTAQTAVEPYGVLLRDYLFSPDRSTCTVVSEVKVGKVGSEREYLIAQTLLDADGRSVATAFSDQDKPLMELQVVCRRSCCRLPEAVPVLFLSRSRMPCISARTAYTPRRHKASCCSFPDAGRCQRGHCSPYIP